MSIGIGTSTSSGNVGIGTSNQPSTSSLSTSTSGISGNQSLWHWVSASGDKMNLPVIDTIQYNPELQVQFEKWGYLPDKVSINLLNLRVEL